jgi:hypothetical protein
MITLSFGSAEFHICAGIDASVVAKDVSFRAYTLTIGTHRTALAGLSFEIGVVSIFCVTLSFGSAMTYVMHGIDAAAIALYKIIQAFAFAVGTHEVATFFSDIIIGI